MRVVQNQGEPPTYAVTAQQIKKGQRFSCLFQRHRGLTQPTPSELGFRGRKCPLNVIKMCGWQRNACMLKIQNVNIFIGEMSTHKKQKHYYQWSMAKSFPNSPKKDLLCTTKNEICSTSSPPCWAMPMPPIKNEKRTRKPSVYSLC